MGVEQYIVVVLIRCTPKIGCVRLCSGSKAHICIVKAENVFECNENECERTLLNY